MRKYGLFPNKDQLANTNWMASNYCGAEFVKAKDEKEARQIASSLHHIASSRMPDGQIPTSPWKNPELVNCYVIH